MRSIRTSQPSFSSHAATWRAAAGVLVGGGHLGVLASGLRRVEAASAVERGARDGAGGEPAEVVGRAEEDVEQATVLGVDPPGSLSAHVTFGIRTSRESAREDPDDGRERETQGGGPRARA